MKDFTNDRLAGVLRWLSEDEMWEGDREGMVLAGDALGRGGHGSLHGAGLPPPTGRGTGAVGVQAFRELALRPGPVWNLSDQHAQPGDVSFDGDRAGEPGVGAGVGLPLAADLLAKRCRAKNGG